MENVLIVLLTLFCIFNFAGFIIGIIESRDCSEFVLRIGHIVFFGYLIGHFGYKLLSIKVRLK